MSKVNNTKNSAANNSTGAFEGNWDIEKYRDEHECEEHWQLRKAFMEKWKKNFPEERLICLARVYTNIEFMGCRYPAPVMQQIAQLSFEVGQKYKDKKKTKLQRTFVSASTAAEDRARGIKRVGGEIVTDEKPKSTRIAFVAQGEIPAPVEDENVSDEEGMILLKGGASSTFLVPGGPAANALSPSVGTGLVLAKTAAETKTQSLCKQRMLALIGASTNPSSHTQVKTTAGLSLATQAAALDNTGARVPVTHPPSSMAPQANLSQLAVTCQAGVGNFTEDAFEIAWQVQKHKGKDKCTPQAINNPSGPSAPAEQGEKRYRKKRSQNQRLKVRRKPLQAEAGITRPECSGQPAQSTETTQRPDRNDRVTVKRALNDTLSPRREHKRPHLDQSKRASHLNYAQTGSATLNVAVTCARTGILSKDVSGQVLSGIQKQILLEACSPKQNTPGPTFNGKPVFAEGVLKLWCGNENTLAWLKKTVSGLSLPSSSSLVVRSQSEIQKRARCGIVIPNNEGVFEEPTIIWRTLSYQNPWVDIQSWVLLDAKKQAARWFVVVGVPEVQIPTIMKAGRRLSMGAGEVYVKFQGRNGRYVDVPHGWDPATEGIGEQLKRGPKKQEGDEEGAASDGVPFVAL